MAKSIKSQKVFAQHWTQGSSVHCVFQDMGEGAGFEPATVGMAISFQKWHIVHSFSSRRCFINESGQIWMTITLHAKSPKISWLDLAGTYSFRKCPRFPESSTTSKTGHWRCLHARDLCSGLCCLATKKDGSQLRRNCLWHVWQNSI